MSPKEKEIVEVLNFKHNMASELTMALARRPDISPTVLVNTAFVLADELTARIQQELAFVATNMESMREERIMSARVPAFIEEMLRSASKVRK